LNKKKGRIPAPVSGIYASKQRPLPTASQRTILTILCLSTTRYFLPEFALLGILKIDYCQLIADNRLSK
jgi:hypothetical protein